MIIKIMSLILIFSCSSLKREISSVNSNDSEVSRIVQMGFVFDEYNLKDTDIIKLKFKLYKFSMFVSRDIEVNVKDFKALGSLDKYTSISDEKGIVEFIYSPIDQNEDVSFDIVALDKIFTVNFKVVGAQRKKVISVVPIKPIPLKVVKPKVEIPKLEIPKIVLKPVKPVINYNNSKIIVDNADIIPSGLDSFIALFKIDSSIEIEPSIRLVGANANTVKKISKGLYSASIIPLRDSKLVEIEMYVDSDLIDKKDIELNFKPRRERISDDKSGGMMVNFNDVDYKINEYSREDTYATGKVIGFSVTNYGVNSIIPDYCAPTDKGNEPNCKPQRAYHFNLKDQATQNLSMNVDDYVNFWTSQSMHSEFVFFPRSVVPSIKINKENNTKTVTLPTNEEVIFDLESSQILSGVLEEGPMDVISKNRFSRKFPNVRYKGEGVVIRINARGQSPSQGQFNNKIISGDFGDTGAKNALIYKFDKESNGIIKCIRPKSDLWEQGDINPIPFKFKNDDEFRKYLTKHCEFSF